MTPSACISVNFTSPLLFTPHSLFSYSLYASLFDEHYVETMRADLGMHHKHSIPQRQRRTRRTGDDEDVKRNESDEDEDNIEVWVVKEA